MEPTNPPAKIKIIDKLLKLRDEGKTILISTHISKLAQLGDKQIFIKNGKIHS